MKKCILAILTLALTFTLFSCASDTVRPPDLTRPDLDLTIPVVTDPPIYQPIDSDRWQYDPNPYDNVNIYGGVCGKDQAIVTIENNSSTLTVQISHTVSRSELIDLGITAELNIKVSTTYTVLKLNASPAISFSSDSDIWMLHSDEYSVIALQEITSLDGNQQGLYEYYEARYQQIKNSYVSGEFTEEQYNTESHLLSGCRTPIAEGNGFKAFVKLDNDYGVCRVNSVSWTNKNGYENTLTHTYSEKERLQKTVLNTENKQITIGYNSKGNTESTKSIIDVLPDGSRLNTEYSMYNNGDVHYVKRFKDGEPFNELIYYKNGQVQGDYIYRDGDLESYFIYYEDGNLSSSYYIEDEKKHSKAYYPDGKTLRSYTIVAYNDEVGLYIISEKTWYESGALKSEITGDQNGLISETIYNEDGTVRSSTLIEDSLNGDICTPD